MHNLLQDIRTPALVVGTLCSVIGSASAQQFQPWTTTEKPSAKSSPAQSKAQNQQPVAQAVKPPLAPAVQTPSFQIPVSRAPAAAQDLPVQAAQPATIPSPISEWPKLLPKAAGKAPERWSEAEIADAQKSCVALLKGLDLVAVGAPPILEGAECGAAAPIELISVGTSPQVTFSPPVTVTCDMAAALHGWVTKDVQASARKHIGTPIVRIDTMSSYSCRTAYGRAGHRLSEHGKANAVDIRAFMTAKAETADVLASWGPTVRDVQAQVAAVKAAEDKARALAATKPAAPVGGPPTGTALAPSAPAAVADGPRGPSVIIGTGGTMMPSQPPSIGLSTGFPQPSRLGGPKPLEKLRGTDTGKVAPKAATPGAETTVSSSTVADRYTRFLRDIHASACNRFGTVLGPEANNAHRNHFHVDAAKRAQKSFCE